jgi:hypothetical protein
LVTEDQISGFSEAERDTITLDFIINGFIEYYN